MPKAPNPDCEHCGGRGWIRRAFVAFPDQCSCLVKQSDVARAANVAPSVIQRIWWPWTEVNGHRRQCLPSSRNAVKILDALARLGVLPREASL